MIPSPKDIVSIGQQIDQLQLNGTSYSIQTTYQISLNQLSFKMMHSLRGESQKIIQATLNNINSTKNPDDKQHVNNQPPEISSITH